jgi:hypothetical protein
MKPHIKVIQRNGVDIFVTSSMTMKCTKDEVRMIRGMQGVQDVQGTPPTSYLMSPSHLHAQRDFSKSFSDLVDSIKSPN